MNARGPANSAGSEPTRKVSCGAQYALDDRRREAVPAIGELIHGSSLPLPVTRSNSVSVTMRSDMPRSSMRLKAPPWPGGNADHSQARAGNMPEP